MEKAPTPEDGRLSGASNLSYESTEFRFLSCEWKE